MKMLLAVLITAFIAFDVLILTPNLVRADQQSSKDEGADYAKSLMDGVKNISKTTDANTIPGFSGTDLPQTEYYKNQDLGGLESDSVVNVTTGSANEAAQFAYDQALKPKLIFPDDDPILVNADTIGGEAVLNPELLTIQSGNCTSTDGNYTSPELEHCTAWFTPTNHTCNNTLSVDVTWDEETNCSVGIGFSERKKRINKSGKDDYVYARAFCNPGIPDDEVSIQVDASDGDPKDCTGWETVTLSTDENNLRYTGKVLRPRFSDFCTHVPVFAKGVCTNGDCQYTATFYQLVKFQKQAIDKGEFEFKCMYPQIPLDLFGFNKKDLGKGTWRVNGLYCAYKSASVTIDFKKPETVKTPIVEDTWSNGCAGYEDQVE